METAILVAVISAIGLIVAAMVQNYKTNAQFRNNGGGTIKDQLDRVEVNQDKQFEILMRHDRELGVLNYAQGITK